MKGVISAPQGVITGVFNIRFAFFSDMEMADRHVKFETVSGDALDGTCRVCGGGQYYQTTYYIPENRCGVSRVLLEGDGIRANPVEIEYDTYRSVSASFGAVERRGGRLILPVRFSDVLVGLTKRHFRLMGAKRCSLYGKGQDYDLHIVPRGERICVDIARQVCKASGIMAEVDVVKLWL